MKYIVFSDIHGNIMALNKMVAQTKGQNIDGYIFCGDIFGYFNHPKEVICELNGMSNLYAVKGNHDNNYLFSSDDIVKKLEFAEKYGVSYFSNLSEDEKRFLYDLPEVLKLNLDGRQVAVTHGGLNDHFCGRVYPDTFIDERELYFEYDIVILGHTHYQMVRYVGNTIVLNPGSLGQPRDYKGFSYCILDTETLNCTFHTVTLDKKALLADLIEKEKNMKIVNYIRKKMEVGVWKNDI